MEKPRIACEIHDGIAEVVLMRGDKLNALDRAMFSAIDETLTQLARHKGLRAVILHGEGRAFLRRAGRQIHAQAAGGGARYSQARGG